MSRAEHEAESILEYWRLQGGSTPVEPALIARSLGIDVFEAAIPENASGVLLIRKDRDPAILLNASDSPNRQRFTTAHELGHYVDIQSTGGLDEDFEHVDFRDDNSTTGADPREVFANSFAAALLMPREEVIEAHGRGDTASSMSLRFGVSGDAMTFRLKNLGLA